MIRPEVAGKANPLPVEKILATILLDQYGEVSYDFQSLFSSDLGRAVKALCYGKPLLGIVAVSTESGQYRR